MSAGPPRQEHCSRPVHKAPKDCSSRKTCSLRKGRAEMTSQFTRSKASRRQVLKGAAAVTGAAVVGMPATVRAQAKGKIVIGTWGGDYAKLLNKNIEQP